MIKTAIFNLTNMLEKRGYELQNSEQLIYKNKHDKYLKGFICQHSKLNIERIKIYIQELETLNIKHCIIIYDDVITSSCKKIFECMVKFAFETFHMNEMQYDITKHDLYNHHEKLTKEELSKLTCISKFPIILKSDPVARYFHFQRGDVIRVRRKNGIIVYRVVK